MAKQIRLKNGTVLKVEYNDCPCGTKAGYCGLTLPGKEIHCSICDDFPHDCPLEEWQDQAASFTCMAAKLAGSCPVCSQYLTCPDPGKAAIIPPERDARWDALEANIKKMGVVLAEKDAEIAKLRRENYEYHCRNKSDNEISGERIWELNRAIKHKDKEITHLTNDKSLCIQELDRFKKKYDERVTEVMRLNDKIALQYREIKDLAKALEYKCQMREAAEQKEPPKDEPELMICPKGCDGCAHGHIHKCEDPDDCGSPCEGYVCIPVKKKPTVPQMQQSARRENTVAGALHQAIEVEGSRIDAYAKKQINFDMRLDKLEKEIAAIREKVSKP
jgi:hypothetical protein